MQKQYDVTAIGELLIDFTENGLSSQGNPLMEANPGGAPCNVLAMLQKLGHMTAFIGRVGDDMFGRRLKTAVEEIGIDTDGLVLDREVNTTLAFVHTAPDGDRDFSFYRNPGADMRLCVEDIRKEQTDNCVIFHFGTLSSTHEGCRAATRLAVERAKRAGAVISFDPNIREPLWRSLDDARRETAWGLSMCDILKISDNEILWFTEKDNYDDASAFLQETYHVPLILLSMGREGSRACQGSRSVTVPALLREDTVETTGAGDTFCACVLHYVLTHGLRDFSGEELTAMLTYANTAASLITTRKGALRVMPSPEEIENAMKALG